jgi:quercetin dioxygenase-like cupin family protein
MRFQNPEAARKVIGSRIRRHGMRRLVWGACLLLVVCFNAGAAETNGIHSETLVKSGSSWDGAVLPQWTPGAPEITILRITVDPGAVLPLHEHPVINAGVLVKGQLKVTKEDGKTLLLKAGDPIVEVVNARHSGKNEGAVPAEIIVFYAGKVDAPITVIKGQENGSK